MAAFETRCRTITSLVGNTLDSARRRNADLTAMGRTVKLERPGSTFLRCCRSFRSEYIRSVNLKQDHILVKYKNSCVPRTLFASGDSITKGRLISPCKRSLRLDPTCVDRLAYHFLELEQVFQNAMGFDIIHFHFDYLHYPFSRRIDVPHVTAQHGRLDLPDLLPLYGEFADMPVVSISNSQRIPLPRINWQGTVYHGLPLELYKSKSSVGSYLAFVGRISPEKRLD